MKKTLSILMSLVLVFALLVPTFATDEKCDCGTAPVIQVRGIGSTLVDQNGEEVFSAENIVAGILPVIPQLAEFLVTYDTDVFVDGVDKALKSIFGPVMFDNNLNRENVISSKEYSREPVEAYMDFEDEDAGAEGNFAKTLYNELGENHAYLFTYDWTCSPFDVADDLNDYIQDVKTKSGHDKVTLCAESMGGCMASTYLAVYGYEDVYNVIMSNAAHNGLEMIGQLFIGNPQIDGYALAELIVQTIYSTAEYASLIPYIPVFEGLALCVNHLFEVAGERIYKEVLIPVFGYMPSFWAFVPEYHYDEAKEFMLADAGDNLKAFVDDYYNLVASKTAERAKYMVESEDVNYFVVSNYNRYIAPVTISSRWNSDGVIETYNTSGYATVADIGTTLGEDYVQAVDTGKDMISPDNVIDASTCQAPNQTWFIKNLGHVHYDDRDGTAAFTLWLCTAKEQYTVDSNPDYPQFLYYNYEIPMLYPYVAGNGDVTGDSKITAIDACLVLKHSTGIKLLPDESLVNADVNGDGEVTVTDARIILKLVAQ